MHFYIELTQDYLKLQQQTLYLAVQVVDRFVMTKRVKSTKLQLVGVTSLLIAAKYEERFPPPVSNSTSPATNSFSFVMIDLD